MLLLQFCGFSVSKVGVVKFAELLISELVIHPVCVTSMQLTSLSHEAGKLQMILLLNQTTIENSLLSLKLINSFVMVTTLC